MNYENKRANGELDYEVYHFVFQTAIEIFEEIFEASKRFPKRQVLFNRSNPQALQIGMRKPRRGLANAGTEICTCQ